MTETSKAAVRVRVDPTNPGQFFACCGLLELADRLWNGAEGWFDRETTFCIVPALSGLDPSAAAFLDAVAGCPLANTMTGSHRSRREELSAMTVKAREADPALEAEKKELDALYREAPSHWASRFIWCLTGS